MAGGRNPKAWNNWYHGVGSTYGTWLHGDPRGFRTYRHREHVPGDYRNPPPADVYAPRFEHSQRSLRHPPVRLNREQRCLVCSAMVERLTADEVEVVALTVAVNHFHLLARFPEIDAATAARYGKSMLHDGRDPAPRHFLGLARKHASEQLLRVGMKPSGPLWAVRPRFEPIRNRSHQVNVADYILKHVVQQAAVYHIAHGFLF